MSAELRIGDCAVSPRRNQILSADGKPHHVKPRSMAVLLYLAERPGELVTREAILDAVWGGTAVSDEVLSVAIAELRKAFGDDHQDPSYVQTFPGKGYSLLARVKSSSRSARRPSKQLALRVVVVGAALLALAISWLASWRRLPPSPERMVTRFEIETELLNPAGKPVLSRDGSKLLYLARGGRGYVRHMDLEEAVPIDVGGNAIFSPDGEWIAFFKGGSLMKVPVTGGNSMTLCSVSTTGVRTLDDWEMEDTIVFTQRDSIYTVSASGGEPQRLEVSSAESDVVQEIPRFADVLPGGKDILMTAGGWYVGAVAALHRVDTGERRVLIENARFARYAPTGHILFERDDTLFALRFDIDRLTVEGEPVPVLENVHVRQALMTPQYSFSDNGTLAFLPSRWEGFRRRLVWVDREGNIEPIRSIEGRVNGPRISPDGGKIAFTLYDGSRPGVWLTEVSRETLTPLWPGRWAFEPAWAPDGERIVVTGHSDEPLDFRPDQLGRVLFVKSLRDDGEPRLITSGFGAAWAPDGKSLVYQTFGTDTLFDIWTVSLEGNEAPVAYLNEPFPERMPALSPDGRWIAYASREGREFAANGMGSFRVFVRPAHGAGQKYPISTGGGLLPVWSPDGRTIFYLQCDRQCAKMMAVEIETEPTIRASAPRVLFAGNYLLHDANFGLRNYDISPDGQRFLMVQREEEPPPPTKIKIVLNWFEELERLVPNGK